MTACVSGLSKALIDCFKPASQKSSTQPPAWNGKHVYFSTNPLHKAISFLACGILAALGVALCVFGHPVIGTTLTLLSFAGIPSLYIYDKHRQIALHKYIKDFLPTHYGIKQDYSDIPKVIWMAHENKITIPFNVPTNLARGEDKGGKLVFFASVNRKEKTVNVFTFDKAYLNKEFSIIVDQEEIKLITSRKDTSLITF